MRWPKEKHAEWGAIRKIEVFLIFPIKLKGESRWLEWAIILQTRKGSDFFGYLPWENVAWANNDPRFQELFIYKGVIQRVYLIVMRIIKTFKERN